MSNKPYSLEIVDDDGNVLECYYFRHWQERYLFKLHREGWRI
jgi:hypothetical protein